LTKATVLVLNRNWQAINVRTPREVARFQSQRDGEPCDRFRSGVREFILSQRCPST
jgi:hypothetical protein